MGAMRIWFLSHLTDSPSYLLLREAAKKRGHEESMLSPTQLRLGFEQGRLTIYRGDQCLNEQLPNIVYTRLGSAAPLQSRHVVRQLESLGVRCVNSAQGLDRCRDKLQTYRELGAAGVPILRTLYLSPVDQLSTIPKWLGEAPWIVKIPIGTKGQGVVLAESVKSLRSVVGAFQSLGEWVLVQEFVREAEATDLRVIVVGGKAIAAMQRRAAADEFRSNLHQGGTAERLTLAPELCSLAERCAKTLGLDVAGVDILRTRSGLAVLEVNGSPGISGIQQVHDFSLGEKIVEYLEGLGQR